MWVPVPPSAEAALAGATVLLNLSGLAHHRRPRRGPPPARAASASRALPRGLPLCRGRARASRTTDLSWDGHDDGLRDRRPARRERALPRRAARARSPTSTSTGSARSGCGRAPSTTTAARTPARTERASARVEFDARRRRAGDIGLRRTVDRFPFVPDDAERARAGLLRGLQHPGLRARAAAARDRRARRSSSASRGGLDSTHALIVAAKAMDRLGPPAQRHPRLHACPASRRARPPRPTPSTLMEALGVTCEEIDIRPAADADARATSATRSPTASRSTTSPSRTSRPGCAPTTSSGSPTSAAASSLGTGDLSELALGWCTYGVGDQMSHYGVNAGVPEDADPAPDPLGRRAAASSTTRSTTTLTAILDHGDQPRAGPGRGRARSRRRTEDIGRPLRAAGLHPLPRAAPRLPAQQDRLPRRGTPGATPRRASGRRASPRPSARHTTSPTIRHWLEVFVKRFFANQFKRSALPNGPKVVAGGSLSPRGDWRMPSRRHRARVARRARRERP